MLPKVIVILGKAGSGKDTLAQRIVTDNRFSLVVTATTRPKRDYEVNGIDYIFMTEEEFRKAEKIEEVSFNGWHYGTPISALSKDKINVIVINPDGFITLAFNNKIEIVGAFEIQANDKERLLRQLNREENPNVDEIARRYIADKKDFQEFEHINRFYNLEVEILKNETELDLDSNCAHIWAKINNQ